MTGRRQSPCRTGTGSDGRCWFSRGTSGWERTDEHEIPVPTGDGPAILRLGEMHGRCFGIIERTPSTDYVAEFRRTA